jgi:hypothetical protein
MGIKSVSKELLDEFGAVEVDMLSLARLGFTYDKLCKGDYDADEICDSIANQGKEVTWESIAGEMDKKL